MGLDGDIALFGREPAVATGMIAGRRYSCVRKFRPDRFRQLVERRWVAISVRTKSPPLHSKGSSSTFAKA